MAKKSQRRIVRYEKDQAGCMWGLIRIFDFRFDLTSRKLLSNRRRENQHAVVPYAFTVVHCSGIWYNFETILGAKRIDVCLLVGFCARKKNSS